MKTVGKQLQDARMAKGWSPELAARETKIRVDRLNELEADDYSNFSSPTYARGFVRTYARSLGLDEYKILRQLDNKLPEDDNASFANDTGVPYMPEASKVSKPFEVGRGVYIAAGIGATVLMLIGFILVQVYRAGYFAEALPATMPNATTNSVAVVPDETTSRALPADSNAPPVALPVDAATLAAAPAETNTTPVAPAVPVVTAAPVDTNVAPRALPVDLNALSTSSNAAPTASVIPAEQTGSIAPTPAGVTPVAVPAAGVPAITDEASTPTTTPLNTATPPRAQPVDLNALSAAPATNIAPAPVVPPAPRSHAPPALSARQANARPSAPVVPVVEAPRAPIVVPAPAPAVGAPSVTPTPTPSASAAIAAPAQEFRPSPELAAAAPPPTAPSSLAPETPASAPTEIKAPRATPIADPALTDGDSTATGVAPQKSAVEKRRGKRLVLTATHDSFVRVVALDGGSGEKVRYSSMLHSGESISFNDRKYTINVGDPAAVDIALDGINYGPHSDHSEPDTFTVESHQP